MNESIESKLPTMAELNPKLAPYQKSDMRHSIFQLVNTLVPYIALWVLMALSLKVSYWITLALAVLAAGFMIRLFIFFHDCGHNSFFPNTRLNRKVGFWLGVLVFTPSEQWWKSHAIHHASSGNLDKRGIGDVETMTLEEFYDKHWLRKVGYRFFRNPLVMFILGPIFMFVIMHRIPRPYYGKRETRSVIFSNLAILAVAVAWSLIIGWQEYLMIQIPVLLMGGSAGIFLFYVQHQFEDTYWERTKNWNYVASALLGASFFKLPRLLQWFSGSIGFHHVHHLSPRIPNYNLEKAHENVEEIKRFARVVTMKDSIRTVRLKLWNEPVHRMEGFPVEKQTSMRAEVSD